MNRRLRAIRHVALDMDGTIYSGNTLFATTLPFLNSLTEMGIGYTFLTNNPSKSVEDYLAHLSRMNIPASPENLYTSAQATIKYLRAEHPLIRRLFMLGTPSMAKEFSAAGFTLLPDSPGEEPDAVIVGFDTTLTFSRLCRAAWWIRLGKPYFGTNPDRVCPTDEPTVLVDCGSLCAALQAATDRKPAAFLGKPDPAMLRGILDRHGLQPSELAMVGDRLYTDIQMAHNTGALGVLVFTGETSPAEAAAFSPAPDISISDIGAFGALLRQAKQEATPA